jgi:hypothetical protein
MAFRTQKISQMTPKGADLEATDLIEVSTIESGSYVTRSITGQELIDAIPAPTGFVPETRTLTINGVTQDLSADRTFTIATGLTVGTTPIASGTVGRVLFEGASNVLQESANLFWDNTNGRLGIGTSSPGVALTIVGNTNLTGSFNANSAGSGFEGYKIQDVSTSRFVAERLTTNFLGIGHNSSAGRWDDVIVGAAQRLYFYTGASERARFAATTGNVLINTTTDAGFRLDVNGTARVQGSTTIAASSNFGLNITRSGTSGIAEQIYNSAGTTYLGADSSAGAFLFTNGLPYASFFGNGANYPTQFGTNGAIRMTIFAGGNVGINTTTDAGFRLDVNGTARVSGNFQANANVIFGTSNGFYWDSATQRLGLGTNSPQVVFHIQTGTSEKLRLETSGTIGNFVTFYNSGVRKGYLGRSSSNDDLVYFNEAATGNLIFGSNGTERMRIKSNGVINMSAIPTSSAGLSAGDVWNDGGTLKIV